MTECLSSIGPAVGNHLWQSTAFAAVVWLTTLFLRRNQARVRYGLWLAASVKFLIPFSLLVGLGSLLPKPQHVVVAMPISYAMDTATQPFTETPMDFAPVVVQASPMQRFERMIPLTLGIIWLCGMMAVLAVWGVRWRQVAKTLRQAVLVENGREWEILRRLHKAMGAGWQIPLLMSQKLMEPGMFGIFRPVLIWPERLSERLDDEHIEAILAHELRHARRKDNLTAVIHMVVEAAFWFHPLVWWMERRMVEERERACDEAVVEMGSRPGIYAESLLKACRFCVESPLVCVSGITGADLSKRVLSIMTLRLERMGVGKKVALALFGVIVIATPIMLGQMNGARLVAAVKASAPVEARAVSFVARVASPMELEPTTPSNTLIASPAVREFQLKQPVMMAQAEAPPAPAAPNPAVDTWMSVSFTPSPPSQVSTAPGVMSSIVHPVYPDEAKAAGIQGSVVLHAVISKSGTVENVTVVSGPHELRQSAIDAVSQWKYNPRLKDGQPVESEHTIGLMYQLPSPTPVVGPVPPADEAAAGVKQYGGDVTTPLPIYEPGQPEYTELARTDKVQGAVTVSLVVDEHGLPQHVQVVRGLGDGLDEKAVDLVKHYQFRPAKENDKPVAAFVYLNVDFKLN